MYTSWGYRTLLKFWRKLNMKQYALKTLSSVLAISMLLSVAACSKKNGKKSHSGEKITDDSPWFDSRKIEIEMPYDKKKIVDYDTTEVLGADKDYVVIYSTGSYRMPEDMDWDSGSFSDYQYSLVNVYGRAEDKTVNTIDLGSLTSDDGNGYISNVFYENGKVIVRIDQFDIMSGDSYTQEKLLDPLTGDVLESREVEGESGESPERTFEIGEYRVETFMEWETEKSSYSLSIIDPDGSNTSVEVKKDDTNIWDISIILPISDKSCLVIASSEADNIYFTVDLAGGTVKENDPSDYEWLGDQDIYSVYYGNDGQIYSGTIDGIVKIDMKKKKVTEVFNYDWCGVSRSVISELGIADISDDSLVLGGSYYNQDFYTAENQYEVMLYEFTRAEKNPHAGKTVMELFSSSNWITRPVADAILKFNETNSEYFIKVTSRYDSASYFEDVNNIESDDEWEAASLKAMSGMSNDLAIDLMNGDGPDILMETSSFGQLNNPNYLVDLKPLLGDIDSDKYFTNIIDGTLVDGALYQLPITFSVMGIQTKANYAGKSGVGFTTKEYEEFLNKTLNGKDVITSGQAVYFTKLFNAMDDVFIKNGKADFTGPEFAELAEYVKNNVQEASGSWNDIIVDDDVVFAVDETYAGHAVGAAILKGDRVDTEQIAICEDLYGFGSYLYNIGDLSGGNAVLGIPSSDGRGPMSAPDISVAISAQAVDENACAEFVKILMSEEIQEAFAMNDEGFTLSRDAFRKGGKAAVEYYNTVNYGMGATMSSGRVKFTEADIDMMEKNISNCSKMNSPDSEIGLIFIEEMPSYFSGQKELPAVVTIIQDRVQKVLDERG